MLTDARYHVDVVAEAGGLLQALTLQPYRFTLTELSVATGLSKNKTFRLLYTLVRVGLVQQDTETKRYSLGVSVLPMAGAVQASNEILLAARDTLDWLQDTVGERINLGVLDGPDHAICIDTREGTRRIQISARIGARIALHAGAIPKVLLACSDDATIADYIARNSPLHRYTTQTAPTAEALWDALRQIRRAGVAISDEDLDLGAASIAVPIYDRAGAVVAAVSIAVPIERFGLAEREEYELTLRRASERISRNLGYVTMYGRHVSA